MDRVVQLNSYWMVVAFLFGLCIGSFLNVVAYRLPLGESVVWPRSHCPRCKRPLAAWELVPVLSWLWLGGRCRTCETPISIRYPVLELATGVLFALTVLMEPTWPERWVAWLFWTLLMAVAGTDMTCMRVPDVLSLPGAVMICIGAVWTGLQAWSAALAGAAVCAGLLWLIHHISKGRMGLGDVKLYLSIGAFLGPLYGIESFVFASFSGVLAGLILRALGALRRQEYIPFVPHIVAGVVLATVFGPQWTAWYLSFLLR